MKGVGELLPKCVHFHLANSSQSRLLLAVGAANRWGGLDPKARPPSSEMRRACSRSKRCSGDSAIRIISALQTITVSLDQIEEVEFTEP